MSEAIGNVTENAARAEKTKAEKSYSGRGDSCNPASVVAFHPIRCEAVPRYGLLEQGKEWQDRPRKADKQLAGAYGGDGAHLFRDTGHLGTNKMPNNNMLSAFVIKAAQAQSIQEFEQELGNYRMQQEPEKCRM